MRKLKVYVASIAILQLLNAPAKAQDIYPVYRQAETYITFLQEKEYEIVRIEYDLLFSSKSSVRTLTSAYNYGIIAFGDKNAIESVDLIVYRKSGDDWIEEARDIVSPEFASVVLRPERNDEYRFEVKVRKFKTGFTGGYYGIIVFHDFPED